MKILKGLLIIAFIVLFGGQVFDDGSCKVKVDKYPNANMRVLTFSWTGDAGTGAVPDTTTSATETGDILGWYVYTIETNPGTTPPTPSYDIVVNDAEGLDISGGMLADRSDTDTEKIIPRLDTTYSIFGGVLIDGALTLKITNQTDLSATGTVKLLLSK